LTIDELEKVHQERVKKIVDLGLSGVMSNAALGDEPLETGEEDVTQEKGEIIDNVIQEMEDFGELE